MVVDYVARLADAWDGRGLHPLTPPTEHLALLAIARLQPALAMMPWDRLGDTARMGILTAARRAVDLGRACAWVFGEGRGA